MAEKETHREKTVKEQMDEMEEEEAGASVSANKEIIFGVVALCLAGYIVYSMRNIVFLAKIWPLIVAFGFIGVPATAVLIRGFLNRSKEKASSNEARNLLQIIKEFLTARTTLDAVIILGSMAVSIMLIGTLGFVLSAALFAFIIVIYFSKKPIPAVGTALVVGLIIYAMKVGFSFSLPGGMFKI